MLGILCAILAIIVIFPFATFATMIFVTTTFMVLQLGASLYSSLYLNQQVVLKEQIFLILCSFSVAVIVSFFSRRFIHQRNELKLAKEKIEKRSLELQEANDQLKKAMDKVKILSGFIPICASCKRIRDDAGYWNQLENYIQEHSEAEFSHSLCADCVKKLYPDIDIDEKTTEDPSAEPA